MSNVKVSKSAYKDLVLLDARIRDTDTNFVNFPETATKNASIAECIEKEVIIEGKCDVYTFLISFADLKISE